MDKIISNLKESGYEELATRVEGLFLKIGAKSVQDWRQVVEQKFLDEGIGGTLPNPAFKDELDSLSKIFRGFRYLPKFNRLDALDEYNYDLAVKAIKRKENFWNRDPESGQFTSKQRVDGKVLAVNPSVEKKKYFFYVYTRDLEAEEETAKQIAAQEERSGTLASEFEASLSKVTKVAEKAAKDVGMALDSATFAKVAAKTLAAQWVGFLRSKK